MYIYPNGVFENELCHYGIPGMKWGVRRYDYVAKGTYKKGGSTDESLKKRIATGVEQRKRKLSSKSSSEGTEKKQLTPEQIAKREKLKRLAKYAGIGAGTALLAYGGYRLHQMNKEQQAALLKSLSGIDKNVTTKGWSRDIQNKLQREVEDSWKIGQEATKRAEMLYQEKTKAMMTQNAAEVLGWTPEQRQSHNAKLAAAFDIKLARANKAAQAAGTLNMIKTKQLKEYAQIDPRNVTKLQAAGKTFKSSTGNVKNALKDASLTKAARLEKAKDLLEAERIREIDRKITNIQTSDSKKILEAYVKDPDKFINGEVNIPDYAAISQNRIEKLRKSILKSR